MDLFVARLDTRVLACLIFRSTRFISALIMPYFPKTNLDQSKMVQEYGSKSNAVSAVPRKENGHASESALKY